MSSQDTKDRILQAAKELFAEKGFPATSMREITTRAGVNLAAINYHFGSKEGLLHALMKQCIEPINEERLRLLDAAEAEAREQGTHVPLRDTVRWFLEPAVRQLTESDVEMPCILARMHHEPHPGLDEVMTKILAPVVQRFVVAVQAALPQRTPTEIVLRGHFMIGAMLHLLDVRRSFLSALTDEDLDPNDHDFMLEQLISFCTAGFQND